MRLRRARAVRRAGAAAVVALLALPVTAPAQTGEGFLFRPPPATLSVRLGFDQPLAQSDVFTQATDELTLRRRDFGSVMIGGDVAARLAPRLDLVLGASFSGVDQRSEYRDWLDQDDLPIEQTTIFRRVPVTAGVRLYLAPRGRAVGSLAWIPARLTYYVGAGVGAMWYRFRQSGDWVNLETLDVYRDRLDSDGWTMVGYGVAGVEVSLGPRFFLTSEARSTLSNADLGPSYYGFDRIDLSGLALTVGIGIRQ